MNRWVALLIALLLSNIGALACATAYALCVDCPERQPAVCAHIDPCTTADVINSQSSTDLPDALHRPIAYAGPPITSELTTRLPRGGIAANTISDLPPSLPLTLRFCEFLK